MSIDRDEWLKALDDAVTVPIERDAEDTITTVEFAALIGRSRPQAARRLQQMVEAGKAQRTTRAVRRHGGGIFHVPAFRLVK